MNDGVYQIMRLLLVLTLAILMSACGVRSLNGLTGNLTLTGEDGVTIRDNRVDVITITGSNGFPPVQRVQTTVDITAFGEQPRVDVMCPADPEFTEIIGGPSISGNADGAWVEVIKSLPRALNSGIGLTQYGWTIYTSVNRVIVGASPGGSFMVRIYCMDFGNVSTP